MAGFDRSPASRQNILRPATSTVLKSIKTPLITLAGRSASGRSRRFHWNVMGYQPEDGFTSCLQDNCPTTQSLIQERTCPVGRDHKRCDALDNHLIANCILQLIQPRAL